MKHLIIKQSCLLFSTLKEETYTFNEQTKGINNAVVFGESRRRKQTMLLKNKEEEEEEEEGTIK